MQIDTEQVEFWLEQLEPGDRSRVEASITASDRSRRKALETQQALVHFAKTVPPMRPTPSLGSRILSSLDDANRFEAHIDRLSVFLDLPPDQVRDLLREATSAGSGAPGWQETGLIGMISYHFKGGPNIAGTHAQLLQLTPGFEFPNHRHQAEEWGYVLEGLLLEDSGHEFASGDLVHKNAGSSHSFNVKSNCPALLFVLLEGPIQWL